MSEKAKYQTITLYSAERYYTGQQPTFSRYINVTGKTPEQIKNEIDKLKEDNRKRNEEYKKARASGQIPTYSKEEIKHIVNYKKELNIRFDENTGNTFALFGASKSGKTTLMMRLYKEEFKKFISLKLLLTTLYAMNPQLPIYNQKYLLKFPVDDIDAMNRNEIKDYIEWQRKVNKLNDNKFQFLNMFDDFINMRYNELINNLILTYRNSNISSVLCLQYVNLLSKQARSNINHIFLLHMNTDESIEVAIKVYLQSYIKKHSILDPINWYKDVTRDHHCIYLKPAEDYIEFISL